MVYAIKSHVAQQIATLPAEEFEIVNRCIYHYTHQNICYRLHEWYHAYPDWNQSINILTPRKFEAIPDNDSPVGAVVANAFAALNYIFQESGENKLIRLIRENS